MLENLDIGRQPPRPSATAAGAAWTQEKLLPLFPNLGEMPNRPRRRMSGGEQQMLTVARTLMGNPLLVLLDEPSEGVAPLIVEQMANTIIELKQEGLSILLSEQNVHFAELVSDRAYVLEKGQIRWHGSMAELANDVAVQRGCSRCVRPLAPDALALARPESPNRLRGLDDRRSDSCMRVAMQRHTSIFMSRMVEDLTQTQFAACWPSCARSARVRRTSSAGWSISTPPPSRAWSTGSGLRSLITAGPDRERIAAAGGVADRDRRAAVADAAISVAAADQRHQTSDGRSTAAEQKAVIRRLTKAGLTICGVALDRPLSGRRACRIARSRCGVTGSRVIAPGMPIASSMAAAIAAPTALTPPSPAPLRPSGLSGLGASSVMSTSSAGTSRAVGMQIIGEIHRQRLAALVVEEFLEQRAADALRERRRRSGLRPASD